VSRDRRDCAISGRWGLKGSVSRDRRVVRSPVGGDWKDGGVSRDRGGCAISGR